MAKERRFWKIGFMSLACAVIYVQAQAQPQEHDFKARVRKEGRSITVEHRAATSWEAKRELEAIYGKDNVEWVYPKPRSRREEAW